MPRILFVSGFHPATRARDLAYEFERCVFTTICGDQRELSHKVFPLPNSFILAAVERVERPTIDFARVSLSSYFASNDIVDRTRFKSFDVSRFHHVRTLKLPLLDPRSYAFVEFRSTRDAEDAYYDMHGRHFEGSRLSIQWAKNPPSSVWRSGDRRGSPPPRRERGDRERSRSPRRRSGRDRGDRERDRDPRDGDRDVDGAKERLRSRSPIRKRSPSPPDVKGKNDRAKTPPPVEEVKKEDDRARTPPYEQ